jgi:hypothetical protein
MGQCLLAKYLPDVRKHMWALYTLYAVINANLHLKLRNFTPLPHEMFRPQRAITRCLVVLKLPHCIKYIECLFIHTMCKCGVSCLIYLMYTRFVLLMINYIDFLI